MKRKKYTYKVVKCNLRAIVQETLCGNDSIPVPIHAILQDVVYRMHAITTHALLLVKAYCLDPTLGNLLPSGTSSPRSILPFIWPP
jgi:hypothetical protein